MEEKIKKIVNEAVNAPSGHNYQPWKFVFENNSILLFIDSQCDTTIYNYKQFGSYVAHGALTHNITIVASHFGYKTEVKRFPDPNNATHTATITFSENSTISKSNLARLYPYVRQRASNRKPYKKKSLSKTEKEELLSNLSDYSSNLRCILVENSEIIENIAKAFSINDSLIFNNRSVHSSIFTHIVWTEADENRKKRGLFIKTLELPAPVQILFRLFKYWPIARFLGKAGMGRKVAEENEKTYSAVSAIGGIVSESLNPSTLFSAGILLEEVWLRSEMQGLSMQLVMGTLYLANYADDENQTHFSSQQIELLKEGAGALHSSFGLNARRLLVTFRLGRSSAPSALSSKNII